MAVTALMTPLRVQVARACQKACLRHWAAAFGLMLIATTAPLAAEPAGQGAQITVTGQAEVAATPDMAMIDLGVTTEAPGAAQALAANTARMTRVQALLAEAGIAPRDMQTSALALDPIYERTTPTAGPPRIAGHVARNMLTVRVRDLAGLGALIDRLVTGDEPGGDLANSLRSLRFGLADPAPAQAEARRRAVADARARAALIAEAAGLRLGPVLEITEGASHAPAPMLTQRMAMASDAVPIAAGEVSASAQVTIIWALEAP